MKHITALLFFCFSFACVKAQAGQDSMVVDIASISGDSSLISRSWIYIDKSASLSIPEVLQKDFSLLTTFKERRKIPAGMIPCIFYLKIRVSNNSATERSAYLYPGSYFTGIRMYKVNQQILKPESDSLINGYTRLTLAAGERTDVLIRLEPMKNDFNGVNPRMISLDFMEDFMSYSVTSRSDIHIFGLVLSGVVLMMILFMLANFILGPKPEFLYNALYSLCMFFLIFFNSYLARKTTSFAGFYFSYLDFFLLVAGVIFYISFTRNFINTKESYKTTDRILRYGEYFVLFLLGIYSYLHFFTDTYLPQYYLENIMKFLILAIGVFFIYFAAKQKDRLLNYLAAGNAMLVIFSAISLGIIIFNVRYRSLLSNALFYYYVGIILELIFFLLGLTYKNRRELIRGIKEQEALKLEAEKKEFETQLAVIKAQQEERNRISADMHDDLGAGMTTIRLYSELAKSKLTDNSVPEIDKISSSANELLNKMNAIIWSMSSSNDSLGNMIAYIRSYALEYFEDTGVTCRINIPDNLPNVEVIGEIRRNVFLVVKEALNNILKHSKATEVAITLVREENELILYIQDNGIGIDLDALRQFGNGLKNMKKRMTDVGIEFSIENRNGTLVTLRRKVKQF